MLLKGCCILQASGIQGAEYALADRAFCTASEAMSVAQGHVLEPVDEACGDL